MGAYVSMSGCAQATVYVRRPRQSAGVNPLLSPCSPRNQTQVVRLLRQHLTLSPLIILPLLHYPLSLKLLLNIRTWAALTTAQPPTYIQHSLGNKMIRSCDYEPSTLPVTVTMHKTPTAAPRVTSRNKKCVLVVCLLFIKAFHHFNLLLRRKWLSISKLRFNELTMTYFETKNTFLPIFIEKVMKWLTQKIK